MRHSWIMFMMGLQFGLLLTALLQDWYGSLDAYVEHLRSPGAWVQVPLWVTVPLLIALFVGAIALDVRHTFRSERE